MTKTSSAYADVVQAVQDLQRVMVKTGRQGRWDTFVVGNLNELLRSIGWTLRLAPSSKDYFAGDPTIQEAEQIWECSWRLWEALQTLSAAGLVVHPTVEGILVPSGYELVRIG